MSDHPMHRLTAAAGVSAVALLMVGNEVSKIEGTSPGLHDSPAEYMDALGTFPATIVGTAAIIVRLCLFVVFFAEVANRFAPAGSTLAGIAFGAGLVAVSVGMLGASPMWTAALLAEDGQLQPLAPKELQMMNGGS